MRGFFDFLQRFPKLAGSLLLKLGNANVPDLLLQDLRLHTLYLNGVAGDREIFQLRQPFPQTGQNAGFSEFLLFLIHSFSDPICIRY